MTRRAAQTDLSQAVELLGGRRARAGACPHPPTRLYGWLARDDTSPGSKIAPAGFVFCIACCACGAVIVGGADLEKGAEPR